jgi:hypothetical protein
MASASNTRKINMNGDIVDAFGLGSFTPNLKRQNSVHK